MSQQKSKMPFIVIGFIALAIAAFFGLNMGNNQDSQQVAAESPAPSAFERADQAAAEAFEKAQEAAQQAAEGTQQAAEQATEATAQKFDEMSAEAKAALAPAAGSEENTVNQ